jgi:hypothetical protein
LDLTFNVRADVADIFPESQVLKSRVPADSELNKGVIHELTLAPHSMKIVPVIHARPRSKSLRSRPMGQYLEENGDVGSDATNEEKCSLAPTRHESA